MKDINLRHKVTDYLESKARSYSSFPQSFTPTIIGNDTDAYIPRIGIVAEDVVHELRGRGIQIEYVKTGNSRVFVIYGLIELDK